MYRVAVRDRVMIAHSFTGEIFGPAQGLHGATYVVEAEFRRKILDPDGLVVDIGLAHTVLHEVLAVVNYKNLDELEVFAGTNTTTEFLAGWLFNQIDAKRQVGGLGAHGHSLGGLRITLHESDVAWAAYDADFS